MTNIIKREKKYSSWTPVYVETTESWETTYPIDTTPISELNDNNDNQGNGQGQDWQGER